LNHYYIKGIKEISAKTGYSISTVLLCFIK